MMKDSNEQKPGEGARYDRPIFGGDAPRRGRRRSAKPPRSRGEIPAPAAATSEAAGAGRAGDTRGSSAPRASGVRGSSSAHSSPSGSSRSDSSEAGRSRAVAMPRKRRMGLQTQFMLFSALALAIIGLAAWWFLRPVEAVYVLDSYQYATVTERDFRDVIVTSGTVEPETVAVFGAPADATVEDIFVEVGEDVAAGAALLQLVSKQLLEDVDEARRDFEDAEFDLEQARLKTTGDLFAKEQEVDDAEEALAEAEAQLPLTEELFALGGVSAKEMQDALAEIRRLRLQVNNASQAFTLAERQGELTVRQAEQTARTAERALAKLQEQVDEMTVTAPRDGRVLSLSVRPDERVKAGDELLRHADVARQDVKSAVTPQQAAQLEPGTTAVVRVGGRSIPAVVSFVAPLAQTGTDRTAVPVTLTIDGEAAASLRPFTEASVELELGVRSKRPALSRGPFFASGDAGFVYIVSGDGTEAERREVRYGAIDGNYVEITAGLEPGDEIVYSSYTAFRTHSTVELVKEGGRFVE